MVGVGGVIALGLAVPVVAAGVVAVPIYGGYRLRKHIKEKKKQQKNNNLDNETENDPQHDDNEFRRHTEASLFF